MTDGSVPRMKRPLALRLLCVTLVSATVPLRAALAAPLAVVDLPSPAAAGAVAPQLAPGAGGPWLSWVEPAGPTAPKALRVAQWKNGAWTPPSTVVAADDLMANWADVPGIVELAGGDLVAHWLRTHGSGYAAELRRSQDGGATWQALGALSSDAGPSEHGFVSHLPLAGGLQTVWMDGRSVAKGGATELFAAAVGERATGERLLDERVCDCCATASAATADGAVVVYRDRTAGEVRDIGIVRYAQGAWQKPALVHADGWKIHGCPVNGPAVAARGALVVVAWYTGANERPRVLTARSTDGGATFGDPVTIDDAAPFGRVGVALDASGDAVVSWLARAGDAAELRLRRVGAAGRAGAPLKVTALSGSRTAGIPRLLALGDRFLLTWVEPASGTAGSAVRVAAVEAVGVAAAAP